MQYQSSKGPVEISAMPLSYAKNAMNKLIRGEPDRTAEIDALRAHVEALEAEAIDKNLNPRAAIGGNNPPEEVSEAVAAELADWGAIKIHLDDLLSEAGNWADGVEITSQGQADAVARLKQDLQQGATLAENMRVAEKKPLDDQITEIQDRYNAYIAPLKNKKPGSVSKATQALGNMLTSWLTKLDDERREREREAADKAAQAAAEALAAHTEAKTATDIEIIDRAEDKMATAEALLKQARGVSTEKVRVQGSTRAIGLRSYWLAEITDSRAALLFYISENRAEFDALVLEMANRDAKTEAGRRPVPGVKWVEDRRAA